MIRSTLKNTVKESIWYGAATLAARLAPIILLPFYVRWFSPEGLGAIQGITAFAYFWYIVMALQLCSVSMRFYYEYKSKDALDELIGTILCILLVSVILLGLAACLYSSFISRYLFDHTKYQYSIILATISTCIWVINDYFFTLLRLEKKTRKYLFINLIQLFSNVFLNYLCIRTMSLGLNGAFWALVLSQILTAGMLVGGNNYMKKPKISRPISKRIITYICPLIIVPVLEWFRNYYYQVYTLQHLGESDLGTLSVGIRVVQVFILIDAGLSLAWYPAAMSVINHPRGKELYRYYYRYSFVIYVLSFIILSLFSKEAISLIAPSEYKNAFRYVPILFLLPFSRALLSHYSIGIWIAEKTTYVTVSYGMGVLVSVIAIHVLGLLFHQCGVLFGAATGSFVITFALLYFSERFYLIGYSLKPVWYFIILAAVLIFYNIKIASSIVTPLELVGKSIFTLAVLIAIYHIWLNERERIEIKTILGKYLLRFKVAYSSDS